MPVLLHVALVLAAACALPRAALAAARTPAQFPPDAAVQRLVDGRVQDGSALGVVVGLLEADGAVRIFGAGSNASGTGPIEPHTVFRIGSLSAVLTGSLLVDMTLRGEASPDDPIDAYLPEGVGLPQGVRGSITLADLATHRAGLPEGGEAPSPRGASATGPYVWLVRHARPRDQSRDFRYSPLGVDLLGQMLASRLGLTWEEAVRVRVQEPLGMDMTGPDRATAVDLLRFVEAHAAEPHTPLEQALRMAHHARARIDREWTVGLTWMIRTVGDRRTVWQTGGAGGDRAFVGFDPDRGIGVVVLAHGGANVSDLGFHLLEDPGMPTP